MNKTQLVDALAASLGDRKTAAAAVDGILATIVDTVKGGDSVSITGFGVFEPRARAARVARNPRTGDAVDVPATTIPAFRPGVGFRTAVGGSAPAPRATPARPRRTAAASAATNGAAPATTARRSAKAKASFAAEPAAAPKTAAAAKTAAAPKPKAAAAPKKGTKAAKEKAPKPAPAPKAAAKSTANADGKPKKAKGKK
ncbi:HU family DNA-binding protein [Pseudonocardia sp.]|uniref:HU family DNA-binding protein n=1 Tax=Pseudonocardia sp. TaxID=60912 RepID=UPI002633A17A|nr:HU family DNA-binding protein [Pseudonocardia sp.]